MATASLRLEAALGGYDAVIAADAPTAYWKLNETAGTTAEDQGAFTVWPLTYTGGVTLGAPSLLAAHGSGVDFDGTTGYATMGSDVSFFDGILTFSVECWIQMNPNWASTGTIANKFNTSTNEGWHIRVNPSGEVTFTLRNTSGGNVFSFTGTGTVVDDGEPHHVVCTWNGATGGIADAAIIVDGVAAGGSSATGTPSAATGKSFAIGGSSDGTVFFDGIISRLSFWNADITGDVAAHYAAGLWSDLTADVIVAAGLSAQRGMVGGGPRDRIASTGTFQLTLRNDAGNSGSTEGWYSPNHASHRSGWAFGVPIRLMATYASVDYPLWRGRVRTIAPTPGRYLERRVLVTAQDCMGDLAETLVRAVAAQVNKDEAELLGAVAQAMPEDARPPGLILDAALDEFPYAFDDIGSGAAAMRLVTDVVTSTLGTAYPLNTGALRYTNRQTRSIQAPSGTIGESQMLAVGDGLIVPSSLGNVFNRVRCISHQKTVDSAATTVLYALPEASASLPSTTSISIGDTITIWGEYRDPANTLKLIGGTAQVTPVATTDYLANAAADGSGANHTATLTVAAEFFASTVKLTVTNGAAVPVFVTKLQARGKGIYDNAPATVESYTAQDYGDRPLELNLPYQDDANVAQGIADYLKTQYMNLANQVEELQIDPQASNTLMLHALQREIGDVLTVTETMTGLAAVDVTIQGVALTVSPQGFLRCRWSLAPSLAADLWILEDAEASLLGETTVLGYV